jgi:hypothetical protein
MPIRVLLPCSDWTSHAAGNGACDPTHDGRFFRITTALVHPQSETSKGRVRDMKCSRSCFGPNLKCSPRNQLPGKANEPAKLHNHSRRHLFPVERALPSAQTPESACITLSIQRKHHRRWLGPITAPSASTCGPAAAEDRSGPLRPAGVACPSSGSRGWAAALRTAARDTRNPRSGWPTAPSGATPTATRPCSCAGSRWRSSTVPCASASEAPAPAGVRSWSGAKSWHSAAAEPQSCTAATSWPATTAGWAGAPCADGRESECRSPCRTRRDESAAGSSLSP